MSSQKSQLWRYWGTRSLSNYLLNKMRDAISRIWGITKSFNISNKFTYSSSNLRHSSIQTLSRYPKIFNLELNFFNLTCWNRNFWILTDLHIKHSRLHLLLNIPNLISHRRRLNYLHIILPFSSALKRWLSGTASCQTHSWAIDS